MSIASSLQSRTVYCEGKSGGLDAIFFTRLLTSSTPLGGFTIRVEPIGGKSGWGKFFDAYAQDTNYMAVRDRDLDKQPIFDTTENIQLQYESRVYFLGLPSLESYFLKPSLLVDFLQENNRSSPSIDELELKLQKIAQQLIPYYTVRWAFQDLRNSGIHVPSLGDISSMNLDESACINAAHTKLDEFRQTAAVFVTKARQTIKVNEFNTIYQRYKAKFIANTDFLFWFDGKDLLKRWFEGLGRGGLSSETYSEWAASKIEFKDHPDLLEFQRICWYQK